MRGTTGQLRNIIYIPDISKIGQPAAEDIFKDTFEWLIIVTSPIF